MRSLLTIAVVAVVGVGCSVPVRQCSRQTDCFGGEACVNAECVPLISLTDVGNNRTADIPPDLPPGDCRLNEAICEAQVCNVSTGLCENCQRDLQCGAGGLCDMTTGLCNCAVGFHACGGECAPNDAAETCGDLCEPCPATDNGSGACSGGGACTFTCDAGFRLLDQRCIQCETTSECTGYDASACSSARICQPCSADAECSHLDRKVCADGVCEVCDTGDAAACGNNSCDPATRLCTSTAVGSRDWCESCVADNECEPNHRCVPMFYAGNQRPDAYCLREADSQCLQPDPIQVPRDSLSGVKGEVYCVIREDLVTCEAVNDFGRPCDQDDDCGVPGLADGKCRLFDGLRQCTYACVGSEECSNGTTCIGNPPDNSYCARF